MNSATAERAAPYTRKAYDVTYAGRSDDMRVDAPSLVQLGAAALRKMILSGELPPGTRLIEERRLGGWEMLKAYVADPRLGRPQTVRPPKRRDGRRPRG